MDYNVIDRMTKIATRNLADSGEAVFDVEDATSIFRHYLSTYKLTMGYAHPPVSLRQVTDYCAKLPYIPNPETGEAIEITPDYYIHMIDQYFCVDFPDCNYNMQHFFSGNIRYYRYLETKGYVA